MSFSVFFISHYNVLSQQIIVNEEWQTEEGAQVFYDKNKTITDGQNNVYIVGSTINSSGNYDLLTAKYNSGGQLQWLAQYDGCGGNDYGISIVVDASYNVFITGTAYTNSTNYNDLVLIKYNSSGAQQWVRNYNGTASGNDYGADLILDNSGGIYVVGGVTETNSELDFVTLNYNTGNGFLNWTTKYDAYGLSDGAVRVTCGATNLTVMGGVQYSTNVWRYAVLTIRKSDGVITRSFIYTAGSSNVVKVTGLTTDASENIYICGTISDAYTGLDMYAIMLDSTLVVQWEYTYNGNDSIEDEANAIGLDGNGNVYITGYTTGVVQGKNFMTVKLNNSGQKQWAVPYNHPTNGDDEAKALVIDGNASIFVTGQSHNGNNFDYFTIKYNTDSSLVWVKSFDNYNNNDKACDIAIDDSGKIVVTGQSFDNQSYTYFTVQYAEYERQMEFNDDTTFIKNEVIIKFAPEYLNTTLIDRKGKILGTLDEFITDEDLIDDMEDALGEDLRRNIKLLKIHKNLTTQDTISTTRLGEDIRIPEFWSSFVMLVDEDNLGTIDVLNWCTKLYDNLFPKIIYLNPNLIMQYMGIPPNDDEYDNQNSLESDTYQNINIEEAWNYETGKEHIKVGIFDGGIRRTHEDFQFTPNECVVNTGLNNWGLDYMLGHGTAVAGIIGAVSNNTIGIAGIAGGDASLNPKQKGVELIDLNNGSDIQPMEAMAEGIFLAAKSSDNSGFGANIINISMGFRNNPEYIINHDLLQEAIEFAFKNNVVMACARGNSPNYPEETFVVPACIRNDWILNIGSHEHDGSYNTQSYTGFDMDLRAPGPRPESNLQLLCSNY